MERVRIITDSREQEEFAFDPVRVDTERHALLAGDYSLAGYADRVAVERKSLDDFVSTVIRSRKRFATELRRLRDLEFACIVVEGSLADVFARNYRSGATPASVFGAVISIIVDHGIPVFFCADRQIACRFTQDYLLRVHRYVEEETHAEP
jgi:DNA excision repair protein ERCC-4